MMHVHLGTSARDLWEQGRLPEAIARLSAGLRTEPGDRAARTFLFELLLIEGEWDRAARQLAALRGDSPASELALLPLAQAIESERLRHAWFAAQDTAQADADVSESTASGVLNALTFTHLTDADPLVGAHLEVFHAGRYLRIPLSQIATVRLDAPVQLWHTVWIPAVVRLTSDEQGTAMGRVLLPTRSWGSERESDPAVRQGRTTIWRECDGALVRPFGQKVLLADDADVGLLDVRSLNLTHAPAFTS
jgi:type VI secretion system protein ImpE